MNEMNLDAYCVHCLKNPSLFACEECGKRLILSSDSLLVPKPTQLCVFCNLALHLNSNHKSVRIQRECSICSSIYVNIFCSDCSNYFCDNCDKSKHAQKFNNHKRSQIIVNYTVRFDKLTGVGTLQQEQEIKQGKTICRHFSQGICRYHGCQFLHICSKCSSTEHGLANCPRNSNISVCPYFSQGYCKNGKSCSLDHTCNNCKVKGDNNCINCINKMKCTFGFFCLAGLDCKLEHTDIEKQAFQVNGGKGFEKKFIEDCKFSELCVNKGISCTYAHRKEQRICFYCGKRGDHLAKDCPKKMTDCLSQSV
jgi:hypothetical protein